MKRARLSLFAICSLGVVSTAHAEEVVQVQAQAQALQHQSATPQIIPQALRGAWLEAGVRSCAESGVRFNPRDFRDASRNNGGRHHIELVGRNWNSTFEVYRPEHCENRNEFVNSGKINLLHAEGQNFDLVLVADRTETFAGCENRLGNGRWRLWHRFTWRREGDYLVASMRNTEDCSNGGNDEILFRQDLRF